VGLGREGPEQAANDKHTPAKAKRVKEFQLNVVMFTF
jgi:hypothetical protein